MIRILTVVLALVCAAPAFAQKLPKGLDPQNTILLDTTHGRIVIKLRNDIAPHHAARIKQLTRDKFYDNAPFHRVIPGFMAQTGDGARGDGTGKSKYPDLKAEFSNVAIRARNRRHGALERSQFCQCAILHLLQAGVLARTANIRSSAKWFLA